MASSLSQKQAPGGSKGASERVKQRLIIIRHGERLDNVDPHWERTAERPYDPPLTEEGEEEVRTVGQERFSEKVGRPRKKWRCAEYVRPLSAVCMEMELMAGSSGTWDTRWDIKITEEVSRLEEAW